MKKNTTTTIAFFLRDLFYMSLYFFDRYVTRQKNLMTIFCYHGVSNNAWKFNVSVKSLQRQIKYLKKNYAIVTMDDINDFIKKRKKIAQPSVVISFDDGYKDVLLMEAFFQKLGVRPILFVLSKTQKANRAEMENKKEFLSRTDILRLHAAGWIIGSHSATHADFSSLHAGQIKKEIIDSKHDLENELGIAIRYFAYPKGRYTKEIVQAVKDAGYELGLSMDSGSITVSTNPYILPRVGVDNSHKDWEFKAIFSPSNIFMKNILMKTFVAKLF